MRTAFLLILCLGVPIAAGAPIPVALSQDAACPECKAKLKPDSKFCASCGTKIAPKACAACKSPLKLDAKFCASCGRKVEEAPRPEAPAENQDPAKPAGQVVDADSVKQKLDEELRKFGTSSDEVNRAIDRGAAYLTKYYAKREMAGEEDFLAAYALIHTNQYFSNGKLRDKINAFLRSNAWLKGHAVAYTAGLRALALEAT